MVVSNIPVAKEDESGRKGEYENKNIIDVSLRSDSHKLVTIDQGKSNTLNAADDYNSLDPADKAKSALSPKAGQTSEAPDCDSGAEEDKESEEGAEDKFKTEDAQDFDPLKGHKYELKFEYNAASKRSRRVLICKYEN